MLAWWYGTHCVLDPSDGVFGRFDLAALGGCHTLNVCYVMLCYVHALGDFWVTQMHLVTYSLGHPGVLSGIVSKTQTSPVVIWM